MNLQEQIVNDLGEKISKEIDFEILCSMLCQLGWSKIILSPMDMETSKAIDEWTESNIKGAFETMGLVWIFEDSRDANWFAMKWM